MKLSVILRIAASVALLAQTSLPLYAAQPRQRAFDDDWLFMRGEAPGAEQPAFNDSQWRKLDLPHDWSIEDLPSRTNSLELEAVTGEWRFQPGDNPEWRARDFNDAHWQPVHLPATWEKHSGHTNENIFGWFRRNLQVPPALTGKDFDLLLGQIDDVDEAWLNGERIGATGSFPPDYRTAYDVQRRYSVPARLIRGDGSDVLAVRVFDGAGDGGIISAGITSVRIGPFDPAESPSLHFTGNTVGGIGWYRKHFKLNEGHKRVSVLFDGIYMNSEIWINGHKLGEHPYGYTAFEFDLTPHLNKPGADNVLAVRVRNEGRNTRWYSGSGIYRHVWLMARNPVHVPTWGLFVTTPQVSEGKAVVNVSTELRNATLQSSPAMVRATLRDAKGRVVGRAEKQVTLPADAGSTVTLDIAVNSPKLWSPDAPYLYDAQAQIIVGDKLSDTAATRFGIRKIKFSADRGFQLNGETLKLKGGCVHHDNGPLGSAAIDRAEERRVQLMRDNGFNAVRTSHNPPSSAFLDACDRIGMLVIDEAFDQWTEPKENNHQGYQRFFKDWFARDIASMVRRDRNHPSVIMWSVGNEIPEQFRAADIGTKLREAVLSHDATRPVTQAICSDWGQVMRNWDTLSDPAFKHLDVAGYNYLPAKYEPDHARHPDRVMYGAESYPRDAFLYWDQVEKHPYVIGDFVWTAIDYLGEAGIGHSVLSNEKESFFMPFPYFNAWCGDIDLCGNKKPQSYYRDVVWRRSPIELMVHDPLPNGVTEKVSGWGWPRESRSWNWQGHEDQPLKVSVYSRCEKVRLELNGRVIGEQSVSPDSKLTARFDVPYAPGELRALGMVNGKVVAQTAIRTAGKPHALRLIPDRTNIRADRNDLCYVAVEVVDEKGLRVPDAAVQVRFSLSGPAELAGHANASPNRPASFRGPQRETFQGRCLAIVRPTGSRGTMTFRAEAEGLGSKSITISARSPCAKTNCYPKGV